MRRSRPLDELETVAVGTEWRSARRETSEGSSTMRQHQPPASGAIR